jgi:hypothetical protein
MTAVPPLSWHECGTLLGILDARLTRLPGRLVPYQVAERARPLGASRALPDERLAVAHTCAGTWQNPPVAGRPSETDRVARAIAGRAEGGFALVSIDGAGGSGKSTLAADLAERLGGMGPVTVVHGDDFYRPMRPRNDCCSARRKVTTSTSTGSGYAIRCLSR